MTDEGVMGKPVDKRVTNIEQDWGLNHQMQGH